VFLNYYHASFRNLIEIPTRFLIPTHVHGFFFLTKFAYFPIDEFS
jgi:hypothetical protein